MEDLKVLCKGENVIIYKSIHCDCVNITLANINIHINGDGLSELVELIQQKLSDITDGDRTIFVETPCEGITLYFKAHQLYNILEVLEKGQLQLELDEIFMQE